MRKELFTFLLFFVLASLLWFGYTMQSVRNTRVPVLIQYTGQSGNIGFGQPGLPDTVQIEVRDAGSRLNTYHRESLKLTIDLRPYIHGEKGTIRVPSDALRRSISDILQGTSRLIETTPEEISCPYYTEEEKTVTIAFQGELNMAAEYQMTGAPQLSHKRMKIYGQEKDLATIDTLYTAYTALNELSDTTELRLPIAIPTGIRAERDSIDIRIATERFTEKKFTLPLRAKGVPEGYRIRLFPREVEVSVRVGMSHFAQVNASDIHAICVYSPERKDKLEVELKFTNPYITGAWAYPSVVEFLLFVQQDEKDSNG